MPATPPDGFRGNVAGFVSAIATPTSGYASLPVTLAIEDVYVTRTAPWLTPAQRGELAAWGGFANAWWVDWGDGAVEIVGLGSGAGFTMEVTHSYGFPGSFQINVVSAQVAGGAAAGGGQNSVFPIINVLQATIPARAAARSSQVRFS